MMPKIKRLTSKYFFSLIEDSKTDSQKMWRVIKKVLSNNVTQQEIPTVVYKRKTYTDAKDIASILDIYFFSSSHTLSKESGRVRKFVLPQICTDTRLELKPLSHAAISHVTCNAILLLKDVN